MRWVFVLLLGLAWECEAEIFDCDGVWTNRPCEGAVGSRMVETPVRELSQGQQLEQTRSAWLNDLERLRRDARGKYDINVSIESVKRTCFNLNSSDKDCNQAINDRERQINELVIAHKLSEKKQDGTGETKEQNVVAVVDNTRNRRHIWRDPPPDIRTEHNLHGTHKTNKPRKPKATSSGRYIRSRVPKPSTPKDSQP